jgi:hypothetical protein
MPVTKQTHPVLLQRLQAHLTSVVSPSCCSMPLAPVLESQTTFASNTTNYCHLPQLQRLPACLTSVVSSSCCAASLARTHSGSWYSAARRSRSSRSAARLAASAACCSARRAASSACRAITSQAHLSASRLATAQTQLSASYLILSELLQRAPIRSGHTNISSSADQCTAVHPGTAGEG